MVKKILIIFIFTALSLISFSPSVFAADTFRIGAPKDTGFGVQVKGDADTVLETVIKNALMIIYSIGGIAVVIFFVWGALDWILAGGDKEKLGAARKKITNSILGLVLLSLSAVITTVVGEIVGFNPLKEILIPGLGDTTTTSKTASPTPKKSP